MGHGLATGRGSDWGTHRQHGAGSYDVHAPTHSVCNKKISLALITSLSQRIRFEFNRAVKTRILPPDKLWYW